MDEQTDHVATSDEDPGEVPDVASHDLASDGTEPTEEPPVPAGASVPLRVVIGICLLVLAALQGVGSFYAWIVYSESGLSYPQKGLENWRGFGWMTLVIAIAIVFVIVSDLVAPSVALKAVTATLFGASGVIAVYFAVQYVAFPTPDPYQTSLGWGLGLCMGAGVVGFGLGSVAAVLGKRSPRIAS